MGQDEARKTMDRMFRRHEKQVEDFATLPLDEKRYVAAKCPGFYAPEAGSEEERIDLGEID